MSRGCNSILVIDDDEMIRETLRYALESEGYSVETAENGRAGLILLRKTPGRTLILLDLMMPVMDGWEFWKALRGGAEPSDSPVVVVTASNAGIPNVETIRKPIVLKTLFKTVGRHFRDQANEY